MTSTTTVAGRQLRMERIVRRQGEGVFLVPLDHSVGQGPLLSAPGMHDLVTTLARHGADGIVVHKGRTRFLPMTTLRDLSLTVHLSASTRHAPDTDRKVLVADVERALQHGADMVSVHVNMGCEAESEQLADLGRVADQCARWSLPLMAMVYPRSPRIDSERDADAVAHAAALAADLGADLVKTPYTGDVASMTDVVNSCPIPIVTAGGSRTGQDDLERCVADVMRSGAAGIAAGRNVFEADDVAGVVRRLSRIVHRDRDVVAMPRPAAA